jgi:DNA-binding HxlR family transcriptional regulator
MCPLNASVEMLGDRWSLLILRDMMLRGSRSYNDLLRCPEKIATNILADRLRKLARDGIITARRDPADRRKFVYYLTTKGIDLAPVMAELVLWAARYEKTSQAELIDRLRRDKQRSIAEVQAGAKRTSSSTFQKTSSKKISRSKRQI